MSLWRKLFPIRERGWENHLFGAKLAEGEHLYKTLSRGYDESKALYLYLQARLKLVEQGFKARPITGDEVELKRWEVDTIDRAARASVLRDILRIPIHAEQQVKKINKKREQEDRANAFTSSFIPK